MVTPEEILSVKQWLTRLEAAAVLGIARSNLTRLLRAGRIKGARKDYNPKSEKVEWYIPVWGDGMPIILESVKRGLAYKPRARGEKAT